MPADPKTQEVAERALHNGECASQHQIPEDAREDFIRNIAAAIEEVAGPLREENRRLKYCEGYARTMLLPEEVEEMDRFADAEEKRV